jgi:hypothetical protein
MRILFVLLLLCASAQKTLAAKDPCDKFSDADAYNNCLAGFGPAAGHKAYSKAPPDERVQLRSRQRALAKSRPDEPIAKPAGKGRVRLELMVPASR